MLKASATADPNAMPLSMVLVEHWFEELKQRMNGKGQGPGTSLTALTGHCDWQRIGDCVRAVHPAQRPGGCCPISSASPNPAFVEQLHDWRWRPVLVKPKAKLESTAKASRHVNLSVLR
jgi:hypothetical protein